MAPKHMQLSPSCACTHKHEASKPFTVQQCTSASQQSWRTWLPQIQTRNHWLQPCRTQLIHEFVRAPAKHTSNNKLPTCTNFTDRDGESEILSCEGTRSIHTCVPFCKACNQISWTNLQWSHDLARPLLEATSAPWLSVQTTTCRRLSKS